MPFNKGTVSLHCFDDNVLAALTGTNYTRISFDSVLSTVLQSNRDFYRVNLTIILPKMVVKDCNLGQTGSGHCHYVSDYRDNSTGKQLEWVTRSHSWIPSPCDNSIYTPFNIIDNWLILDTTIAKAKSLLIDTIKQSLFAFGPGDKLTIYKYDTIPPQENRFPSHSNKNTDFSPGIHWSSTGNSYIHITNYGEVECKLFNMLGREVALLFRGSVGPGDYAINTHLPKMMNKMYIVVLTINKKNVESKLIISQ